MRVKRFGLFLAEEVYLVDEAWGASGMIDLIWGGKVQAVPEAIQAERTPEWVAYLEACREWVVREFGSELPVVGSEIKSAKSYAMQRAFKDGPQHHHMMQLAFYALAADRHPQVFADLGLPVPEEWRLVMIGKDSTGVLEFPLVASWRERTLERLEDLQAWWASGDLPPCTCGQTPGMEWEARYCPYIHPEDIELRSSRSRKPVRCCDPELFEAR